MYINKISYSSWKDFQKCQLYYLMKHVKNIRLPFTGTCHTVFGTSIHTCMEKGILENLPRVNMDKIFLDAFNKEIEKNKIIIAEKEDWIKRANNILDSFWSKYFNKLVKNIYKAEWKFKVPLLNGKFTINGIIDHCTYTKKGNIGVLDYKTGKLKSKNDESEMQLSMYSLAIEKLLGMIPEWLALFYLEHDKILWSFRDEKQNRETEEQLCGFYNKITLMEEKDFEPNSKSCHFCDFKHLCEYIIGTDGEGVVR